jgi:hypothetical protein
MYGNSGQFFLQIDLPADFDTSLRLVGAFKVKKLNEVIMSIAMSVCLSVCLSVSKSRISRTFVQIFQFWLNSDNNNRQTKTVNFCRKVKWKTLNLT